MTLSIKKATRIFALIAVIATSFSPLVIGSTAQAQLFGGDGTSVDRACDGLDVNGGDTCTATGTEINPIIGTGINILSIAGGIICVVMLILAGIKFITSQGDASAISSARTAVIYSVVGLVLIGAAQFIVHFVLTRV